MINWVSENKEWIFSGIGILFFMLVLGFVKWIFKCIRFRQNITQRHSGETFELAAIAKNQNDSAQTPKQLSQQQFRRSSRNPQAIFQEIETIYLKAPPYKRDEVQTELQNDNIGICISFLGFLSCCFKKENDMVYVSMYDNLQKKNFEINFTVSIKDFPEFKNMYEGTPFYVEGKIKSISIYGRAEIDDVQIDFTPSVNNS